MVGNDGMPPLQIVIFGIITGGYAMICRVCSGKTYTGGAVTVNRARQGFAR